MSPERPYLQAGWCVPVPVRPSRFTSLLPEHRALNVEVDLSQLAAFGVARGPGLLDREELLHADLQTHPTVNAGLRLGSGRSGFYRGKYMKGVGRTQLAANWLAVGDVYHGTGHMMASAGVREFIISRYLEQKGAAHLIVPCEGLLLAPLDPRLSGFDRAAFPGRRISPVDRRLQAITVKPGDFARHSNFVWALNQLPPVGHYGRLFSALRGYLGAEGGDPATLAAALAASAERGFEAFLGFVRLGVFWGSFHNNFTLDGRFLDLELPTIFGGPFLGLLARRGRLPRGRQGTFGHVVGCEALELLYQVGLFIDHLRGRLRQLLRAGAVLHPIERQFVEEFVAALDAEMHEGHLCRSREAACGRLAAALSEALSASGEAARSIEGIASAQYDSCFHGKETSLRGLRMRRLSLELARAESSMSLSAYYPDFLELEAGREEARHINRSLRELDRQTTLEGLLRGVERLAAEIAEMGRPARRAA